MPLSLVRDLMTVGVPTCKIITLAIDVAYHRENIRKLTVEDIMTEGIPAPPSDITLTLAAQLMRDKNIRVTYISHNPTGISSPAAFISYKHLVRHLAAKDETELKDLGIHAERKPPLEQFIERREDARKKAGLT